MYFHQKKKMTPVGESSSSSESDSSEGEEETVKVSDIFTPIRFSFSFKNTPKLFDSFLRFFTTVRTQKINQ